MVLGGSFASSANQPSSHRERLIAALSATAVLALGAAWGLQSTYDFTFSARTHAAYGISVFLCELFTTVLLIWRARLIGDAASATLAATYAFCVPLIGLVVLSYPGVGPVWLWQHEGSGWSWFAWRIGWPVGVVAYALQKDGRRAAVGSRVWFALACSAVAIAFAFSPAMPRLYAPAIGYGNLVLPLDLLSVLCNVLAVVLLVWRKRATSLNVWMMVAVVMMLGSIVLALPSHAIHPAVSDATRLLSFFAGVIIVCAVVSEFARLLERGAVLDRTLEEALRLQNDAVEREQASRRQAEELAELYRRAQRIVETLQAAFVPPYLPKIEGLEFQAFYAPATREAELGGDWYDAFVLADGRIALSIGDIFGHGLEAASAMVRLRETLRAVTAFIDSDPAAILHVADQQFAASHPGGIATAIFALFDPVTKRLVLSNAGHPPPILLREGRATPLVCRGIPLGVEPGVAFETCEVVLEPGDSFVLYTDGLIEVDHDIIAGERRLVEVLELAPQSPAEIVAATIEGRQRDDVAIMMLSVLAAKAHPSWHFRSDDAASAPDARSAFTAYLRRRGVDVAAVATAELVFGELVGNVVRHAPGPIEIELTWRYDGPTLTVRDRGPRFVIRDVALPHDQMAETGRGLFLISAFASAPVVTARAGGGNEVLVRLASASPFESDLQLLKEERTPDTVLMP